MGVYLDETIADSARAARRRGARRPMLATGSSGGDPHVHAGPRRKHRSGTRSDTASTANERISRVSGHQDRHEIHGAIDVHFAGYGLCTYTMGRPCDAGRG